MTLLHFQTRAALLKYQRAAARGLAEEARERKDDLADELRIFLDSLRVFRDCKVARIKLIAALGAIIEGISDADTFLNLDLDAADQHFDAIDLTEARALLAEMLVRP